MLLTLWSATVFAAPVADVALATTVTGAITWKATTSGPVELIAFSKLRQGDTVTLKQGATLELVYFADGHTETFAGPVELVVGKETQPTERSEGDALVGEALRQLPGLVKRAELDKGGHTLVRGENTAAVPLSQAEQADLDAARAHYEKLRAAAADDDVLPELYLATVYLSFDQEALAAPVIAEAQRRCASCTGPARLAAALAN